MHDLHVLCGRLCMTCLLCFVCIYMSHHCAGSACVARVWSAVFVTCCSLCMCMQVEEGLCQLMAYLWLDKQQESVTVCGWGGAGGG